MAVVALLGPQRLRPTVRQVLRDLGTEGPVAAVTAGWEERELEDDELAQHLVRPTVNLRLWHRAEEISAGDPHLRNLRAAHRSALRRRQDLYRVRLDHALDAARALLRLPADDLVVEEREAALTAVRRLDEHHLETLRAAEVEFAREARLDERPAVRAARESVAEAMASCPIIAIAGGHVGVLRDLARLFDLDRLIGERLLLAWSAGAMLLASRIVLFHDSPPQGPGNAEVLGSGLSRCGGIMPLPHARRRLRLDDPLRVALLAGRFRAHVCVAMDEDDLVVLEDGIARTPEPVRQLHVDGAVRPVSLGEEAAA